MTSELHERDRFAVSFTSFGALRMVVAAVALAAACAPPPADDGGEPGVGEPCSSDSTFGSLCSGELFCLEARQGAPGGDCQEAPACDEDDFCNCDLTSLCDDRTPTLCSIVDGARLVICDGA